MLYKIFLVSIIFFCLAPPSAPHSFRPPNNDDKTISWSGDKPGSNPDGHYIISCVNCSSNVRFDDVKVISSSVKIPNLKPFTSYKVSVTKHNNITDLTKKSFSRIFQFTTPSGRKFFFSMLLLSYYLFFCNHTFYFTHLRKKP